MVLYSTWPGARGGRENLCLLNTLLRFPPLSNEDEAAARAQATEQKLSRIKAGFGKTRAETVFRLCGPLLPIIDLAGEPVEFTNKRHPCGPGRRKWSVPADGHGAL